MKRAITMLRRIKLHFQMRSMEITLDGQNRALQCVCDQITQERIIFARADAQRELSRLRAEYSATFAPGVRNVWRTA